MKNTVPILGLLLFSTVSLAHPFPTEELGRFSELFISADHVQVRYTLTLTRLLAIEEIAIMNRDGDNRISNDERQAYFTELQRTLGAGLTLEIDGKKTELRPLGTVQLKQPSYRVMLFEGKFPAIKSGIHHLRFRDDNYPGILGPVEITAYGTEGIDLGDFQNVDFSTKYAELQQQPYDTQKYTDAMQMRELELPFWLSGETSPAPGVASSLTEQEQQIAPGFRVGNAEKKEREPCFFLLRWWKALAKRMERTSEKLFSDETVGTTFTLFAFAAFFFFGAVHALTPGHGKAIAAAYLIGSKGRFADAVLLGVIVTITHTATVIALGITVKLLKDVFLPQRLSPVIASASGAIILAMGFWLLVTRIVLVAKTGQAIQHTHNHLPQTHTHQGHDRERPHDHHKAPDAVTRGSILSLGIAGGMVPCPEAFAVLLAAINWNRTLLGISLILIFSLGLALVLIVIGTLIVAGRMKLAEGRRASKLITRYLPIGSAMVIMVLGFALVVTPLLKAKIIIINL